MTKPPLSDEQIAKIDQAIEGNFPLQSYLAQFEIDIPALCATVKTLRAEIAEYEQTDLVPRSRYNAADAEAREAREMVKTVAGRAKDEIERLQSKLSEVERERDAEKKDHQLTIDTFRRQELIWEQKHNDFITEAIELCRAKADEWKGSWKEDAARELAAELEKL